MTKQEMALNEPATTDEAVVDSPATETDLEEADVTPAAGDTGETEVSSDVEDESERGPVPYERFRQVNERAKRADELEREIETFNVLKSDPEFAKLAYRAAYKKAYGVDPEQEQETETEDDDLLQKFGIGEDDLVGNEKALLDIVRGLQKEIKETHAAMAQAQNQAQQAQAAEIEQQFFGEVGKIEQTAGVKLSREERSAVLAYAINLEKADLAIGRQPNLESLAKRSFAVVAADKAEHIATVTGKKREVTSGRPANRGGPTTPSGQRFATAQEAYEDAFQKAFPNGLPPAD